VADPEGLVWEARDGLWGGVPLFTGGWLIRPNPPQKKTNFALEMACFGEFEAVFFVCAFAREKC